MSYFIYRCFDAANDVIYVGCTGNPAKREGAHRRASSWWQQVTRVDYAEFDSRPDALAAERLAILEHRPVNNKVHLEVPESAGAFPMDKTCRIGNCSAYGGVRRLCEQHRLEKQRRVNGDDCSDGGGPWKLTAEQVVDIRRRMSRFENPKTIARSHGITKSMLFRVMKRTEVAS